MAKKKIKKKKGHHLEKKQTEPKIILDIFQSKNDIKSFLEKFKSDVAKKRTGYRSFREKFKKKEE